MIDTRRWVLVEAFLSLGLRFEWAGAYDETRVPREQWIEDDESVRYFYDGLGVWKVQRPAKGTGSYFPLSVAPSLSADSLRHELAHWIVSTESDRGALNFGMTLVSSDAEERAVLAERVIDAMLTACGRITAQALTGGPRR